MLTLTVRRTDNAFDRIRKCTSAMECLASTTVSTSVLERAVARPLASADPFGCEGKANVRRVTRSPFKPPSSKARKKQSRHEMRTLTHEIPDQAGAAVLDQQDAKNLRSWRSIVHLAGSHASRLGRRSAPSSCRCVDQRVGRLATLAFSGRFVRKYAATVNMPARRMAVSTVESSHFHARFPLAMSRK
ncbi:MAG: hypothetical protein ABI277_13675 [Burkholderiaceae bacterium]